MLFKSTINKTFQQSREGHRGEGFLQEEVREKIIDYPIHLIDVRRYPHGERFRTDLKLVFGFQQRASEPEKLTEFINENTKEFSGLTEDAYDMIASMSKTGELSQLKNTVEQKEDYNMCKAIDMMVAAGEKRREERGIEISRNIFRLYMKGYNQKEIADTLQLTLEQVRDILDEEAAV